MHRSVVYINSTTCNIPSIFALLLFLFYYVILLFSDSVFSISPTLTDSPVSALLTYWIISLWRNWKRASSAISSQFSQSRTETDRRQTTAVQPKLTTGINQLLLQKTDAIHCANISIKLKYFASVFDCLLVIRSFFTSVPLPVWLRISCPCICLNVKMFFSRFYL